MMWEEGTGGVGEETGTVLDSSRHTALTAFDLDCLETLG